ncbi:MAG: hypothetical protein ACRC2R_13225 [Xenococcaceae cyanobacterium]
MIAFNDLSQINLISIRSLARWFLKSGDSPYETLRDRNCFKKTGDAIAFTNPNY